MISYIVSSLNRGASLNACLASLAVQSHMADLVVCCNSIDAEIYADIERVTSRYGWHTEKTGWAGARECYESANMVAGSMKGGWLCFPSDDSLYVADFSKIMLWTAMKQNAELVYCDCVYRQDATKGEWPAYSVLSTHPNIGRIDKTCFILRRELFKGFPPHPRGWSDGALIEQLVRDGVRHAKAPGILVVHQ